MLLQVTLHDDARGTHRLADHDGRYPAVESELPLQLDTITTPHTWVERRLRDAEEAQGQLNCSIAHSHRILDVIRCSDVEKSLSRGELVHSLATSRLSRPERS